MHFAASERAGGAAEAAPATDTARVAASDSASERDTVVLLIGYAHRN
jgi:hypothetical protein